MNSLRNHNLTALAVLAGSALLATSGRLRRSLKSLGQL